MKTDIKRELNKIASEFVRRYNFDLAWVEPLSKLMNEAAKIQHEEIMKKVSLAVKQATFDAVVLRQLENLEHELRQTKIY